MKSVIYSQNIRSPLLSDKTVFEEENGTVAIGAEYFYRQTLNNVRQWYIHSKNTSDSNLIDQNKGHYEGASNNLYLEILPDTRVRIQIN